MKKYLWLFLTALCSYIFYFFSLPPSTPYTPPPLPVQEQLLLVPLDSRPPCTLMAQDLGRLASIDVILPQKNFLTTTAHRQTAINYPHGSAITQANARLLFPATF